MIINRDPVMTLTYCRARSTKLGCLCITVKMPFEGKRANGQNSTGAMYHIIY